MSSLLRLALTAVSCLFVSCSDAAESSGFRIVDVTPQMNQLGVSTEVSIQAHTSSGFDPSTLNGENVRLLDVNDEPTPAEVTGDLGGVITISPEGPLKPYTRYRVVISAGVRSADGHPLEPFYSGFVTGAPASFGERERGLPAWRKRRVDNPLGATAVALGPDGRLYLTNWEGELYSYDIDPKTGDATNKQLVWSKQGARIIGIGFDPSATDDDLVMWIGYDDRGGLDVDDLHFTGTLSRLRLGSAETVEEPVVVHLPNGDHPMNQFAFGPDGRLYISLGAITMLGDGPPSRRETPLSASVVAADVCDDHFNGGKLPLDVDTRGSDGYDPTTPGAPLEVFATGIREAYDLCWHSNGQLYAGVNMNDTAQKSPAHGDVPSISVRPDEPLIRILRGKYYGQPNPSRGEYVILGGNPTEDRDPWEITQYPVGVQPEPAFDPSLLIYNLAEVGGPSANGCAEWLGPGPMRGKMLVCFYTATRSVHAFGFDQDGTGVVSHDPLRDRTGRMLQFGAPLDIAIDAERERFYVADFADPRRGDSAEEGGLWLVEIDHTDQP